MDKKQDPRLIIIKQLWSDQPNLTQQNAAYELNITQSAVCQYLSGRIPLNFAIIIKLAKLLNASPTKIDPNLNF